MQGNPFITSAHLSHLHFKANCLLIGFFSRKTQHRLWLEREAIAQERFRKKREDEERKLKEKLEQEVMHVHVTLSKRLLISMSAGVIVVMTRLPKIEVMP